MAEFAKMSRISQMRYATLIFFCILNFSMLCVSIIIGYKLITLFGLTLSAGIYAFPISYMCEDIIAEIYGYRIARLVVWSTFCCLLLFSLLLSLILKAHPDPSWHGQVLYDKVLGGELQLTLAIIFSLIIGDFINIYILTRWKFFVNGKYYLLRSICSTALGEFIDTYIGFAIAFLGVLPFHSYMKLAFSTFLVKLLIASIFVIPSTFLVFILKNKLKLDVIDKEIDFNPFMPFSKLGDESE